MKEINDVSKRDKLFRKLNLLVQMEYFLQEFNGFNLV